MANVEAKTVRRERDEFLRVSTHHLAMAAGGVLTHPVLI